MKKTLIAVGLLLVTILLSLAGRVGLSRKAAANSSSRRVLYYVDPMHPAYKSSEPGIAPDCGMPLEPVYADAARESTVGADSVSSIPVGTVRINPEMQQLIGIRTVAAEKTTGAGHLRILGRVVADDSRVYRVTAGVDGWFRETYDGSVGSYVKKDEKLAAFYSPEFVSQENSYLVASDRLTVPVKEVSRGIQYAADRLRNLGMSDMQIKELGESRQMPENIYVVSPANGIIVARNLAIGQRFEKGMEFYRIVDLSRVWIMADVFENEVQYFRPGVNAIVTVADTGKALRARVANVLPQVDPKSRTIKVRLEADNPGLILRQDMFVDVDLDVKVDASLSVPEDAVLDSGLQRRVFVDRGEGRFEPREVETGKHFNSRIEIVKGLTLGERVVVSGNFLVDSESRLKDLGSSQRAASVVDTSSITASVSNAAVSREHKDRGAHTAADLIKDPNCGKDIDRKAAAIGNTLDVHGSTLYFCSKRCREEFKKKSKHEVELMAAVPRHD
jgi:YHS domain-containing protein